MTAFEPKSLSAKLTRYGVGVGAVAAAASSARATVTIYTPATTTIEPAYFDLQSNTTPATAPFAAADFELTAAYVTVNGNQKPTARIDGVGSGGETQMTPGFVGAYAAKFNSGDRIGDGGSVFAAGLNLQSIAGGPWSNNSPGYLGLEITVGGVGPFYGWANLTLTADATTAHKFTLSSWAVDDTPNEGVLAGSTTTFTPTPEPNSVVCLIAGAAGLAAWRLRRKRAAAAGA